MKERRRPGRPPKDPEARRTARLTINLTPEQMSAITQRAAAEGGLSRSDYALAACLGRPPARLVPAINRKTYDELHRIGVNLNQWMHAINAGQLPAAHLPSLEQLRALVQSVRNELRARRGERYQPGAPQ